MGKLDNNDTFTPYFKDMVDRVADSEELVDAKKKIEYDSKEDVPMDEDFKEEVLTVVRVIKTCEKNSKSVDWPIMVGSFFAGGTALYMASAAIASGQIGSSVMVGGLGVSILMLSIMDAVRERKRAAKNAVEVKEAAGLDDETLKVILQQLAKEGYEVAIKYYEQITQPKKKSKGRTV